MSTFSQGLRSTCDTPSLSVIVHGARGNLHRSSPSQENIPLQLVQTGSPLALSVLDTDTAHSTTPTPPSATKHVQQALAELDQPASVHQPRKTCGMRTATVFSSLVEVTEQGVVTRTASGYQLQLLLQPLPVSTPIVSQGNGNGKCRPSRD